MAIDRLASGNLQVGDRPGPFTDGDHRRGCWGRAERQPLGAAIAAIESAVGPTASFGGPAMVRAMADRATPNLPSRDLDVTVRFFAALGFTETWRDEGWLILTRGDLVLEFFPDPDIDPATSAFGSCLRLDDLDAFYAVCRATGIPERTTGWPRLHPPKPEAWGGRVGALIDPDGSLLRLIQGPPSAP